MLTRVHGRGHIDESSRTQSGSTPAYFSLDPTSAAKQMAALNATSQLRRTSQSGGTSETIFGPRQSSASVAPSESYVLICPVSSHLLITTSSPRVYSYSSSVNPCQVSILLLISKGIFQILPRSPVPAVMSSTDS